MIAPGLYIRKDLEFLVGELSGGPGGLTRLGSRDAPAPADTGTVDVTLHLRERGDGWCHVEMCGDEKGTSLVLDFLTGHKGIEDVLVWDFDHDRKEYSYSLFRNGRLEEQFSVRGPVLDAVSFVSNMRKVELKELINGLEFSLRAMESFGLSGDALRTHGGEKVSLDFSVPPPRSFWRRLLGSLSGEE